MKNFSNFQRHLVTLMPAIILIAAVGLAAWFIGSAYLKMVDGPLTQDRISAQQDRLNVKAYNQFEQYFVADPPVSTPPSVTRNPFGS